MPDQIHPMRTLQQQIGDALDVFYERIGRHHHAVSGQVRTRPIPAADQAATESGFEYTLEIPGMNAADFEVVVADVPITVGVARSRGDPEAIGSGRRLGDEVVITDLEAVSTWLADRDFFLGDTPCSVDALVYAFVANALYSLPNPLADAARSHPNLAPYCERMRVRYFPELTPE